MSISLGPSLRTTTTSKRNRRDSRFAGLPARSAFRNGAGNPWEPLQAGRPEGPPLRPSVFDVVVVHDLARDRMRLSWRRDILEPLNKTLVYDEIVVGNEGHLSGPDLALGRSSARPCHPIAWPRSAASSICCNPQLLVDTLSVGSATPGSKSFDMSAAKRSTAFLIGLSKSTNCPALSACLWLSAPITYPAWPRQENDFPYGDVEIAVALTRTGGRQNGLALPYQVELSWEGDGRPQQKSATGIR